MSPEKLNVPAKKTLKYSTPLGLSLSKSSLVQWEHFDKLNANGSRHLSPSLKCTQRGIGLPATIFIIVILAMIVLAMSDLNDASSRAFVQGYQSQRAFYAAESGAQIALNRIFLGAVACTNPMTSIDFDGDEADATDDVEGLVRCDSALECESVVVSGTTYYTVTSIGTCGTGDDMAQREIQVRARSN